MDILGTDNSRIASSVEEAEMANRASGMRRALDRVHGFFFAPPDYLPEEPQASVADISEARSGYQPEVVGEDMTGLEARPVPVNAEGQVVDMEQRRREKKARAAVEAARASMSEPEPVSIENTLNQQ